jgi:hypothetical protein
MRVMSGIQAVSPEEDARWERLGDDHYRRADGAVVRRFNEKSVAWIGIDRRGGKLLQSDRMARLFTSAEGAMRAVDAEPDPALKLMSPKLLGTLPPSFATAWTKLDAAVADMIKNERPGRPPVEVSRLKRAHRTMSALLMGQEGEEG